MTISIISQSTGNNVKVLTPKCRPDWVKVFCRLYESPIGHGGV